MCYPAKGSFDLLQLHGQSGASMCLFTYALQAMHFQRVTHTQHVDRTCAHIVNSLCCKMVSLMLTEARLPAIFFLFLGHYVWACVEMVGHAKMDSGFPGEKGCPRRKAHPHGRAESGPPLRGSVLHFHCQRLVGSCPLLLECEALVLEEGGEGTGWQQTCLRV